MNTTWPKPMRSPELSNSLLITGALAATLLIAKAITDSEYSYAYIGLLLAPLLLYAGLRDPFIFPLGVYAFLVPFDSVLILSGETSGPTLTKVLGVLTIALLLLKGSTERRLSMPRSAALWLGAFVLWGVLSGWWAIEPGQTFYRAFTAVGLLLLYWTAASYQASQREFDLLSAFCLFGGLCAAAFLVYSYWSQGTVQRATLTMGTQQADINEAAFTLLLPAALALRTLGAPRLATRLFGTAAFLLLTAGLLVTGSRGALLGLLCILCLHFAFLKIKTLWAGLAFAALLLLFAVMPEVMAERWKDAVESGGAGRTSIWYVGLRALGKYWLIGAGLHNFPYAYTEFAEYAPAFKGLYRGAHNIYVETAVELGLAGVVLMLGWIGQHFLILYRCSPARVATAAALLAAFAGCLVSSTFVGTLWVKAFWLVPLLIAVHGNLPGERVRP